MAGHLLVPTQRKQVDQHLATGAIAGYHAHWRQLNGGGTLVFGAQPGQRQGLGVDDLDVQVGLLAIKQSRAAKAPAIGDPCQAGAPPQQRRRPHQCKQQAQQKQQIVAQQDAGHSKRYDQRPPKLAHWRTVCCVLRVACYFAC